MHRSWAPRGFLIWIIALCVMIAVTLVPVLQSTSATDHPVFAVAAVSHGHAGVSPHHAHGHHGAAHEHLQESGRLGFEVPTSIALARSAWTTETLELTDNRLNWTPDHPPKPLA